MPMFSRLRARNLQDEILHPKATCDDSKKNDTDIKKTHLRKIRNFLVINYQKSTIIARLSALLLTCILSVALLNVFADPPPSKPRFVAYYYSESTGSSNFKKLQLYPIAERYPSKRSIHLSDAEIASARQLKNSRHYRHGAADPFVEGDCVAQHSWQTARYPTCNTLHERNIRTSARLITSGYWRDVWKHDELGEAIVLKTQRYEHDYEERNYERHRRDALASERLTSSPYVIDIFGFCTNSALFEYGDEGSIEDAVWYSSKGKRELSMMERLKMAIDVASGISAVHNFDAEGRASVAHTDITTGQFILINGVYKLNDFNRCRFLRWDVKQKKPCGYFVGNNPGKLRAPEEYAYTEQSEKVDIYSMGNIFYILLTEEWPFPNYKEKRVWKKVMDGERPFVNKYLKESTDPIVVALIEAMKMCQAHDPEERASARVVLRYLKSVLREVKNDVGGRSSKVTASRT